MTVMYTTPVYRTHVPADDAEWLAADYADAFALVGNGWIEIKDLSAALNIVSNYVEVFEDDEMDGTLQILLGDVAYPFLEA